MKGEPLEKIDEQVIKEGQITIQLMWFQELDKPLVQVHSPEPLLPRAGEIREEHCKHTGGVCYFHSRVYVE